MIQGKKCIIWGIGNGYEEIINQVHFEIYKGNMVVEALICREEDRYCTFRDGFRIITKEEIGTIQFDYLIIASLLYSKEIRREALNLGVPSKKIIEGRVFKRPLFDFALYSQLIENPITILSDDCWGGYIYNYLGLEFSSPLINILWDKDEYSKFIQKPLYYLQSDLKMVREGNLKLGIFPIGQIGSDKDFVQMYFTHNVTFNEAKEQWNRRKDRINPNNLIVKMGFAASEKNVKKYIDAFQKCKLRKVLFYNGNEEVEFAVKSNRFIWEESTKKVVQYYDYSDYMRHNYIYVVDILNLLAGKTTYLREQGIE